MKTLKYIITLLFLSSGVLMAQDPVEQDSTSLEDLLNVTIDQDEQLKVLDRQKAETGSKSEENIGDTPAVVSVITASDIEKFGANTLVDVLNRATSMYITGSHGFRLNTISIRGDVQTHYNTHVLILIDGRPIRESIYAGMDMAILNAYPLEIIDRIEVLRGPGSVLFGTGAYTGIIHIKTKKGTKTSASVTGGSFDTFGYQFTTSKTAGDLQMNTSVQYYNQQGWDMTFTDEAGVTNTQEYGQENLGFNFSLDYKKLSFRGYYGRTAMDIVGGTPVWQAATNQDKDVLNSRRFFADLGYEFEMSSNWRSTLNFTYNGLRNDRSLLLSRPIDGFSNDFLLEWTHYLNISDQLNLVVGALGTQVTGGLDGTILAPDFTPIEGEVIQHFDDFRWGAYTQFEFQPLEQVKFIAGAQANKIPGIDLDIVPRVGAILSFKEETIGAKILYGQAFRNPAQIERFANLAPVLVGEENLQPENVETLDVQAYYQYTNYRFSISYFNSTQSDIINRIFEAGTGSVHSNVDELESQGVEFEFRYDTKNNRWSFMGSYAYQENESLRTIPVVQNNEVTGDTTLVVNDVTHIPNDMIKAGISYNSPSGFNIGLWHTHMSAPSDVAVLRPDRVAVNEVPDDRNLLSLNINLKLNELFNAKEGAPNTTLNLNFTNILDEEIHDPEFNRRNINSIQAYPGFAFYSTLKVSF